MRTHPLSLTALGGSVLLWFAAARLIGGTPSGEPTLPNPASSAVVVHRDWNLRQTPVVEAVKRIRAAVVNIHSERNVSSRDADEEMFSLAQSQKRVNGMGTGIIIDPRGYIVTNQHVVEEVNLIRVHLNDGTTARATVLARDAETDLALLKIDVDKPLPVMPLGTANDLMVGETVIAVGNAYGYEHTVTLGIVSAVGRDVTLNKEMSYKSLIQTCASINPGNSGGPLVNIYGDLVGVNVAIRAGAQGIGFAIPVDTMIRTSAAMLAARPRCGVPHGLVVKDEVVNVRDDNGVTRQAVIDRVDPNTPAGKAGVQRCDVVTKIDETAVTSSLDIERAMLDRQAGEKIVVTVRRDGAEQKLELVLADLVWRVLGVRLEKAASETVSRVLPKAHGGLLVADLRSDGPAAKAGLQRGDILIGLHGVEMWEMLSNDHVLYVLNHPKLASFNPIEYLILRNGTLQRGTIKID
jgi:serine protease Do